METSIDQNGLYQYLKNLELEVPKERFEVIRHRSDVNPEVVKQDTEQTFLSDKSIVSFVANVKDQNRKDVLNSTLLAQLAANKYFSIETDGEGWYKKYTEVLSHLGWNLQHASFDKFEAKGSIFELENVIIDILVASFGAGYVAIIKKVLESLKVLSGTNEKKFKVFDINTRFSNKGCFMLAVASEENNAVALQSGIFYISSSNKVTQLLFFRFESDKTSLSHATNTATLVEEVYAAGRDMVLKKLKNDITDYIAALDI